MEEGAGVRPVFLVYPRDNEWLSICVFQTHDGPTTVDDILRPGSEVCCPSLPCDEGWVNDDRLIVTLDDMRGLLRLW